MQGNNFYRLKITDNDGKQTTSDIVLLVNNKMINTRFYPNPFKDYIMMHADAGKYFVTLTDAKSKQVFNDVINIRGDTKLPLSDLGPGVYFVSIKDNNGKVTKEKLIKQ